MSSLSAYEPGKVFWEDESPFATVPPFIQALLNTGDFVAYLHRVLVIAPGGLPYNYLTVLRVHPIIDSEAWQPSGNVRLERLILERDVVAETDLTSEMALKSKLCAWVQSGRPEASADTLSFFMRRLPGRTAFGPAPCWRFEGIGSRSAIVNVPWGPFFDQTHKRVYPDVQTAALRWTGATKPNTPQVADNAYHIVIPDCRAYLTDAIVADDGFHVTIERRTLEPLYVVLAGLDLEGRFHEWTVPVPAEQTKRDVRVAIQIDVPLASFDMYLCGDSGTLYDQHTEPLFNALTGDSLLTPGRGARVEGVHGLTRARNEGEGLKIEFKEWVPRDRAYGKSGELLRTAVAFANARGGTIYIGVTDEADVVGVIAPLRREYGKGHGVAVEPLRTAYVKDLRERLLTFVKPRLDPTFEWIEVGQEQIVLAISISTGGAEMHSIEATGEAFIRRSGTNRRATPDDILQFATTRSADVQGRLGL